MSGRLSCSCEELPGRNLAAEDQLGQLLGTDIAWHYQTILENQRRGSGDAYAVAQVEVFEHVVVTLAGGDVLPVFGLAQRTGGIVRAPHRDHLGECRGLFPTTGIG